MKRYIPIVLRIIVALILIQTLRFKFTGHEDSVYIFTKVGLEPFGRIGIGILELIAGFLLLLKKTAWTGALLAMGVLGGAIVMHLTVLGIEVKNDGGLLFYTAVLTFMMSALVLYFYKASIPFLGKNAD